MFKDFRVKDVFRIENPKGKLTTKMLMEGSDIPYVAAKKTENGIAKWCSRDNIPAEQIMDGNCIVFVQQGDGSAGYTTYQPNDFYAISCVCCGYIDGILDEKVGMYLMAVLDKNKAFYNHSNGWNGDRLKETVLALPVVEHPDPDHEYTVDDIDWQYMRDRITELENDRITELEHDRITELDAYLQATGLDDYVLTDEDKKILSLYTKRASDEEGNLEDTGEDEVRFGEFLIGEMFDYQIGDVDLQKTDVNGKGIPIITSGVQNRGILGLSERRAKIVSANTITVDMFGNAFYRDFAYKMVTHARVFSLELKKGTLSDGAGLYICSKLKHLTESFSYNNMCSFNKIRSLLIKLPVTSDGTPDFDYMECYIRAMEKLVIADVMKYKDAMIEATKKMVSM